MVENRNNKRIIHTAITLLIVLILIFTDSASAITVKVDTTNMPTIVGQSGHFYFNVTIGGNEKIPITNFTIEGLPTIPGSPGGILLFNAGEIGTTVGDNKTKENYNIELVKIDGWLYSSNDSSGYSSNNETAPFDGEGYGYGFSGYGYGYGSTNPSSTEYTKLAYKITINTTGATAETYDVIGKINTGDNSKPYFSASASQFTLRGENGTISGTVNDSSTEPINNANVYAINATGVLIGSDQTDSTGKYYISIAPGTYTLNVSASNYLWNNDTTAVVEAGELNSSCDVILISNKVTLVLQSGETSSKIAVKGNATIFNLTAANYGTDANFTVTNISTNATATVKVNGTECPVYMAINDGKSNNFNVTINHTEAGYYPVKITFENGSKTASINLYATLRNEDGNTTIGNCDGNIGNATGGAVLVNSNITSINATVIASTLHNSTVSGNGTIVKGGSTITHGNVTDNATVAGGSVVKYSNVTGADSEVDNGAIIDNSIVDNSKIDNSTIVKVNAKSNTTITNVTIDTGHAIKLTDATVTRNDNGDAQISGSTDAVVVTRNVNFTKVYSDIAIKDLIIDQSSDKTTTANLENTSEINNCKLTVNFSEAALINISETGINPDGEGSDVVYSDVIGNFMHIQSNNTSSADITIRLYYSTSKSYTDDIYIYYYDTSSNKWVQQTTTKQGMLNGRTYIEATPNHLSTFVVMGIDDAPTPTQRSSRSSRSNYWYYHGTPTPTSTESEDTTQTQVSPTKTEQGEVSTGTEQTQAAATPTKTEGKGLPGFGAMMFIAGLLTAAYIIIRKRG